MRNVSSHTITQGFLDYCSQDTDPRLKFILEKLASHLHDFVRETKLTHEEWQKGLQLLFEAGKLPCESMSRLEDRIELPTQWRILLICPNLKAGLSGHEEAQAFEQLPPVSESTTAELTNEVQSTMLPAARAGRLPEFAESVYRYGIRAGECFAAQQGGPFASKMLESWVVAIRRRGFSGVGQSSWGPSLFVLHADEEAATECMHWFRRDVLSANQEVSTVVAPISNQGARLA